MINSEFLLRMIPAGFEGVFIVTAIVIIFFGAKKLPELARSVGRVTSEFEKARLEAKKEFDAIQRNAGVDKEASTDIKKIADH